jgi:2-polyprenyl-3-methyl-5-hydroxy-6-metoxy-1,4-benzoquinol methylase
MSFGIDDFKCDEIHSNYKKALKLDAEKFFSRKSDGLLECPICGSNDGAKIHEVFKFSIIRCVCKFMYSFPRPMKEEQDNFYQYGKSNDLWHQILEKTYNKRKKNFIQNIIPLVGKFLIDKTTLVDIGCGRGTWLDALHDSFGKLKLFGIEPNADDCMKEKYNIISALIEDLDGFQNKFDVCSMMSLVEHIHNPRKVFEKCYEILKKDGIVFLTVPNMMGFDSLALDIGKRNWEIPQHINFFDTESILRLVELSGFDIIECETFGRLDVDIVRKTGQDMKNEFLNDLLNDRGKEKTRSEFQKFLTNNRLSGQIYVVAQKRGVLI